MVLFSFCPQLSDGNKFKRSQSWRKILKKKDKKERMDKTKERDEGKLDGANSGSDSSISQTSTTSSASIGGKRTNGKGIVLIPSCALFCRGVYSSIIPPQGWGKEIKRP